MMRLKDVAAIIAGQSPGSEEVTDLNEGLPFIQGNAEFGPETPTPRLQCAAPPKLAVPGDILLSVRAPVGALNIAVEQTGIGRGLCAIRPTRAHGRYLWWWLHDQRSLLDAVSTGSTFRAVSSGQVGALRVPPLNKSEQRAIADFLDAETAQIDAMVDAQERLIALLEQRRLAVITRGVTGEGAPLPRIHVDSHFVRDVPETWRVAALKRHWLVTDCKHLTADFVEGGDGFPVASINEVKSSVVNLGRAKRTTKGFFDALREGGRAPRSGDLILSRNASVGHVARVTAEHPPFALGQDVCLLRPLRPDKASPRFLQYVLQAAPVVAQMELRMVGSTFRRINVDDIRSFLLPWPESAAEQERIADVLDESTAQVDVMIAKTAGSITLMKERRSALISAAVTGRIAPRTAVEQLHRAFEGATR